MLSITTISGATRTLDVRLRRACAPAWLSQAKLTVWRAGCWPVLHRVCEDVPDTCGCGPSKRIRYVEQWPDKITYSDPTVGADGSLQFLLDDALLEAEPGRYDAVVETACGNVGLKLMLVRGVQTHGISTTEGPDPCSPCVDTGLPGLVCATATCPS